MSESDFVYQAVARAKQVAAKLAAGGGDVATHNNGSADPVVFSPSTIGIKRPATDTISAPAEKRSMVNDKLSAAAEAAAKINEKLGAPSAYSNPLATQTLTVAHRIPDKYVGLVIGKKGEQIIQLQSDSQCKVQISQEGGLAERELTMIGTPAQIERAKQMIGDIIERAGGSIGVVSGGGSGGSGLAGGASGAGGGTHSIDVMIPGLKAGLVIGKNGETIKHLQEVTGAKMVLIQDSNAPTSDDKPLRITGDAASVDKAKDMVIQLLANKDTKTYPKMIYAQPPENADLCVYAVPTEKAGLVIGKGGETIREICGRSGAFVEISKQQTADPAIKLFNVRGQRHEIDNAIRFISERAGIPVGPPHGYYPNQQSAAAAAYGGAGAVAGMGAQAWAAAGYGGGATAATSQQGWGTTQAATGAGGSMPPPTINPQTGQPDYSAAWVEYYRRQGMHEYADMILRQSQQVAGGAVAPGAQGAVAQGAVATGMAGAAGAVGMNQQQAGPMGAVQPGAYGQNQTQQAAVAAAAQQSYDYSQWQQWQQWQQQAAAAAGNPAAAAAAAQQHQAWAQQQPQQQPGAPGVPPQQPMGGASAVQQPQQPPQSVGAPHSSWGAAAVSQAAAYGAPHPR